MQSYPSRVQEWKLGAGTRNILLIVWPVPPLIIQMVPKTSDEWINKNPGFSSKLNPFIWLFLKPCVVTLVRRVCHSKAVFFKLASSVWWSVLKSIPWLSPYLNHVQFTESESKSKNREQSRKTKSPSETQTQELAGPACACALVLHRATVRTRNIWTETTFFF